MDFNVADAVTAITVAGLLALVGKVISLGTRVTVIESHHVGTEDMRNIMSDVQRPLLVEIGKLEDKVEDLQRQIAGRRGND